MNQSVFFTYGSGTFQIAASVLGLRASEFGFGVFQGKVLVSQSLEALLDLSCIGLQGQILRGFIFPLQVPKVMIVELKP